ncbi:hypothetical protein PINS_up021646 [Pythium insidiosum]|nr:hypothetical protein PINS_up021646 [Pythium insidiosum]
MSSLAEAQLAYRSVHHLRKPVLVAFALNSTGEQLRSGEDVVNAIQRLVECADSIAQEEGSEVMLHGVLFNCSQPEDIAKGLHYVHRSETLPEPLLWPQHRARCVRRPHLDVLDGWQDGGDAGVGGDAFGAGHGDLPRVCAPLDPVWGAAGWWLLRHSAFVH